MSKQADDVIVGAIITLTIIAGLVFGVKLLNKVNGKRALWGLAATVVLYTDTNSFLKRVSSLAANFDAADENKTDRMGYIKNSTLNMCL